MVEAKKKAMTNRQVCGNDRTTLMDGGYKNEGDGCIYFFGV